MDVCIRPFYVYVLYIYPFAEYIYKLYIILNKIKVIISTLQSKRGYSNELNSLYTFFSLTGYFSITFVNSVVQAISDLHFIATRVKYNLQHLHFTYLGIQTVLIEFEPRTKRLFKNHFTV